MSNSDFCTTINVDNVIQINQNGTSEATTKMSENKLSPLPPPLKPYSPNPSLRSTSISISSIESDTLSSIIDSEIDEFEDSKTGCMLKKLGTRTKIPLPPDDHNQIPNFIKSEIGVLISEKIDGNVGSSSNGQHQITSLSIDSATDVTFGSKRYFRGPVTIQQILVEKPTAKNAGQTNPAYEYSNGRSNNNAQRRPSGFGITNNLQTTTLTLIKTLSNSSKFVCSFILIVLVIIGFIVFLQLRHNNNYSIKREILFGNNYNTGIFTKLGNGHLVIDRKQWGASEESINLTYPLRHPIPYVLITHMDSSIAEKGLPDTPSNFYVGNDGNIYVGRGWDYANTYASNSLSISFMGDYNLNIPDKRQLCSVKHLLAYGITNKHLAIDYKLVAQNQTKPTQSPGINVYKKIIKWPHWYPCGMNGNPSCGAELGMPGIWNATM